MKVTCVITDDEPFAVKGLKKYVEKLDFLELAGTCEDALELNQLLQKQPVDLLFLDIEMPHLSGVDFVKSLKNPPLVIFTTAYEKYALEGYSLDVLDYLLKPISFDRFVKAANKAHQYLQLTRQNVQAEDFFFIKCGTTIEKVFLQDILFVESDQNYLHLYTSQKKLTAHFTLKAMKEQLPETQFIQPHKSYLAAIDKIDSIKGNQLFIGEFIVPISKYLREEVLEKIVNRNLLK